MDLVSSLRKLALFSGMGDDCLNALGTDAIVRQYPRGAVVVEQGEVPDNLLILLDGTVQLLAVAPERREAVVDIVRAVDMLCLDAVLVSMPALTTARVVDPARVMLIPVAALVGSFRMEPEMAARLLAVLAGHCRDLVRQVKDLKLRTANQRLAAYLLNLAGDSGDPVQLPYDKRLIAARLGMTPESLSRALAVLRRFGVESTAHEVRIPDPDRLRDFARPDDPEPPPPEGLLTAILSRVEGGRRH